MTDYVAKFALAGKIAFVVGGLGLIGREVSRAFAQAGAQVIICDLDPIKGKRIAAKLIKEGGDVAFERFDVTKQILASAKLKNLIKKYGRIDIWVNASYPRTKDWGRTIEKINLDSLQKNVEMQLSSTLWLSKEVAMLMKRKRSGGSIINFGSIYGVQANDFNIYEGTNINPPYAYSAIKAGVINATRYIASRFGRDHIRANTICPGGVFDKQDKKFVANYKKKVPLRRMAKPEEIAACCLFLASDAASYVTGSALMVDGGWTIV